MSALLILALAVAACGGAQAPASSPADQAAPTTATPAAGASPESDQKGAQPAPPPESPSSAPSSGDSGSANVQAELRSARHDLDTARRDLEASQGDCVNVCRALSSLERVTAHFCALASSNSDRDACEDAKGRVYKARARIKASCGTCANGAPLDENAPLTSH